MSHIVQIQAEVRDPQAVAAACRRLGLPEPVTGIAQLLSGQATGLLVSRLLLPAFAPAPGAVINWSRADTTTADRGPGSIPLPAVESP